MKLDTNPAEVLVPPEAEPSTAQTSRPRRIRSRPSPVRLAAAAVLVPLILLPVGYLIVGSLRSAPPGQSGHWTLDNYSVLFENEFAQLLVSTLIVAVGATAVALIGGLVIGICITRLSMPFAKSIDTMVVIPAYIPSFVGAIAWAFLLSPRAGYLNSWLEKAGLPTVNIYTMTGIIFVSGLYAIPVAYLYMRPALQSIDVALEEAARVFGANRIRTLVKVVVPLATPAALTASLIVFVLTLGSFAVVGVLGPQADVNVAAVRIVQLTTEAPIDPGRAAVLGIMLAAVTIIGLTVTNRALRRNDYVTIGSKYRDDAGNRSKIAGTIGLGICVTFLVVAVVLPIAVLVIGSFQPYVSTDFSAGWTTGNYSLLWNYPGALEAIQNSVMLAILTAAICVTLSMTLAYFVVRKPGPFSGLINSVATMPLAIPHVVFAVALLWLWVGVPNGPYNTRWILLLAYVAMFLPFAMQASVNGFRQLDPVLEEAARMGGASGWRIARKIVVPLLIPAALAGATIVLYNTMQEISASLILYSPDSTVMTVAIWELYRNGIYPQLFAMAIIYVLLILALVFAANMLARTQRRLR